MGVASYLESSARSADGFTQDGPGGAARGHLAPARHATWTPPPPTPPSSPAGTGARRPRLRAYPPSPRRRAPGLPKQEAALVPCNLRAPRDDVHRPCAPGTEADLYAPWYAGRRPGARQPPRNSDRRATMASNTRLKRSGPSRPTAGSPSTFGLRQHPGHPPFPVGCLDRGHYKVVAEPEDHRPGPDHGRRPLDRRRLPPGHHRHGRHRVPAVDGWRCRWTAGRRKPPVRSVG